MEVILMQKKHSFNKKTECITPYLSKT